MFLSFFLVSLSRSSNSSTSDLPSPSKSVIISEFKSEEKEEPSKIPEKPDESSANVADPPEILYSSVILSKISMPTPSPTPSPNMTTKFPTSANGNPSSNDIEDTYQSQQAIAKSEVIISNITASSQQITNQAHLNISETMDAPIPISLGENVTSIQLLPTPSKASTPNPTPSASTQTNETETVALPTILIETSVTKISTKTRTASPTEAVLTSPTKAVQTPTAKVEPTATTIGVPTPSQSQTLSPTSTHALTPTPQPKSQTMPPTEEATDFDWKKYGAYIFLGIIVIAICSVLGICCCMTRRRGRRDAPENIDEPLLVPAEFF